MRLKRRTPRCWRQFSPRLGESRRRVRGVSARAREDAPIISASTKYYGLVGPKFTGGHGVWLSDGEFHRLSKSGGAIAFCPCSNLFLGSGLFPDQPGDRSGGARQNCRWAPTWAAATRFHDQCPGRRLQGRHVQQHAAGRRRRSAAGIWQRAERNGLALPAASGRSPWAAPRSPIDNLVEGFPKPARPISWCSTGDDGPPALPVGISRWSPAADAHDHGSQVPTCCSAS